MIVLGKCLSCTNILLLDRLLEAPRKKLWGKVKHEPPWSKSPAGVDLRISTGERHDFGASAPWLTRASSLQVKVGGSMYS